MPTPASYHTPQYAAALEELSNAPVVHLPPLLKFAASVFDVSSEQVMCDMLDWTGPAPFALAVSA